MTLFGDRHLTNLSGYLQELWRHTLSFVRADCKFSFQTKFTFLVNQPHFQISTHYLDYSKIYNLIVYKHYWCFLSKQKIISRKLFKKWVFVCLLFPRGFVGSKKKVYIRITRAICYRLERFSISRWVSVRTLSRASKLRFRYTPRRSFKGDARWWSYRKLDLFIARRGECWKCY